MLPSYCDHLRTPVSSHSGEYFKQSALPRRHSAREVPDQLGAHRAHPSLLHRDVGADTWLKLLPDNFSAVKSCIHDSRGTGHLGDAPLEPLTSTLAMIGNLAPRACANFLTSALLPGSWPPNCNTDTFQLQCIVSRTVLHARLSAE